MRNESSGYDPNSEHSNTLGDDGVEELRQMARGLVTDFWASCAGMARMKEEYVAQNEYRKAAALEAVATNLLLDAFRRDIVFPEQAAADAETAIKTLFSDEAAREHILGILRTRGVLDRLEEVELEGRDFVVEDDLPSPETVIPRLRRVLDIPEDGLPIEVICSSGVLDAAEGRPEHRVPEGEGLSIPLLYAHLQQAYPDRQCRVRLGVAQDLGRKAEWRRRHLICLGADDSNLAAKLLLESHEFPPPPTWIEHGDGNHISLQGKTLAAQLRAANDTVEDYAVQYLGAPNPWHTEARAFLIAGNVTHGTAFATRLLTDPVYLAALARYRQPATITSVVLRATGGYYHLWPVKATVLDVQWRSS